LSTASEGGKETTKEERDISAGTGGGDGEQGMTLISFSKMELKRKQE